MCQHAHAILPVAAALEVGSSLDLSGIGIIPALPGGRTGMCRSQRQRRHIPAPQAARARMAPVPGQGGGMMPDLMDLNLEAKMRKVGVHAARMEEPDGLGPNGCGLAGTACLDHNGTSLCTAGSWE